MDEMGRAGVGSAASCQWTPRKGRPAALASPPFPRSERRGSGKAARGDVTYLNSRSRSHLVAIHLSPAITGAPPCSVRVDGWGRS